MNKNSFLFYLNKAPYSVSNTSAHIDIMMTAAAFDQVIYLVFGGDGVYQLLKNQKSKNIGLKNISQIFPALELYDIKKTYVEASALRDRNINSSDLTIAVQVIEKNELTQLMASAGQVFLG